MSLYANHRDELVERMCRLVLHDWWSGSSTAAGTDSTLIDTANRKEEDDYFNNMGSWLYLRSGTYKETERPISDFANSSSTITWVTAYGAAPGTGVLYSIHHEFRRAEINEAINTAIEMVAREAMAFVSDDTLELQASTYLYPLPNKFAYIYRVTMADSDGRFKDAPIPAESYVVRKGNPAYLQFVLFPDHEKFQEHEYTLNWIENELVDGRHLLVEGLGKQPTLTSDTDLCYINPSYVVYQAAALLLESRIRKQDNDEFAVRFTVAQKRADLERKNVSSKIQLPINSKRCME